MESPLMPSDRWRLNAFLRTLSPGGEEGSAPSSAPGARVAERERGSVGGLAPSRPQANSPHPPVVSVYVPAGREARFIKVLEGPPREASPEPDLAPVAAALRKTLETHGPVHGTLCLFGWSPEAPQVRSIEVPAKLRHSYSVAPAPHAGPLRDLLEPQYTFVLVQTDHQDATVRRYEGFDIVAQKKVHSYVERHHKKGGASAARYQRGQQEQIHQHLVKVRQTLEKFVTGADLVLVGGPGTSKALFMDLLGAGLAPRARLVEGLGPTASGEEFFRILRAALDGFRGSGESALVELAVEGTRAGLFLAGPRAVAEALEAGAVGTLLVAVDAKDPAGAIPAMLEAAARTGARVEFITRAGARARLRRHGEVAARLRYPLSPGDAQDRARRFAPDNHG